MNLSYTFFWLIRVMVILSLFSKFTHFPHSLTIKIESQIIVFLWTIFYGAAMLKVPQSYKCRYKK